MAKDFQLIHLTVDEERLKGANNRLRNQFVGCMHAHNELTILNRLLMFTMNDTGDRYNPVLKIFHNRLAATNKKPKVIIVAVMRKMITTLNAMVRDNAAWQPRTA